MPSIERRAHLGLGWAGALLLALMLTSWPTRFEARVDDPVAVTASGGCKVWMREPNWSYKLNAAWSGKCDEQGYATGEGRLYLDGGSLGKEAFVGEMREGRRFNGKSFQNAAAPCLPKQSSGQMTSDEHRAWEKALKRALFDLDMRHKNYPCRNDQWFVEEEVMTQGKGSMTSIFHFGVDAEKVATATGVTAFAANVRAQAPKRANPQKPLGDTCTKTQIVNGKKFCIE